MAPAYNLEQIAKRKGIPIFEPFQGARIGLFHVLSPQKDWYVHELIADFEKSPEQKAREAALAAADSRFGLLKRFTEAAKRAVTEWTAERWDLELLREDVETSAENESSVILYAWFEMYKDGIFLAGDAGVRALARAVGYLESHNINVPASIKFCQVPHHGSRHNVSTSILDRLLGPRLSVAPANASKWAYASASQQSDYPRKMVQNAFLRRGADVQSTKGQTITFFRNMPTRGWSPLVRAQFSSQVEAWDG